MELTLICNFCFFHTDKEYDRLSLSETEKQAVRDTHITGRCHVINDEKNITYYLDGAHTTESVNVAKEWFLANCPVYVKDKNEINYLYT